MDNEFRVLIGTQLDNKSFSNLKKQINGKTIDIKLKINENSIKNQITSIKKQIQDNLKNINVNLNIDGNKQNTSKKTSNDISDEYQKLKNLQKKINSINLKLPYLDVKKNKQEIKELEYQLNNLENDYKSLFNATAKDLNSNQINELNGMFEETARKIDVINSKLKDTQELSSIKLSIDKNNLSSKMDVWLKDNSAAVKEYGSRIEELKLRLEDCDEVEFRKIKSEFLDLQKQAKIAGKATKTFTDRFKTQVEKLNTYFTASTMITEVIGGLKKMYQAVYEIDTAMTNLYKVTDETAERYDVFLKSSAKNAKDLGRSVSSYVTQTADWAKLGYSLDESEQLSKFSSIYANVAEVDDATAVSDMVTAMKAFNIEAEKAQTIIDPLNELGNKFATNSAQLGEGLAKSASAMNAAGTDMYKTLAMLTGGAEITQNAGEFGSFLKVGSMRVRGMKGELEALGEEVDSSVDSISKVQTQILNLTHGKVNIFDSDGEFKDYFDIINEISKVVDKLSSTEKASLYEILFGKMRGNQGAALIQAFQSGQIEKAYETALSSEGSAIKEQERWMNSFEAKIGQLTASAEAFSSVFLEDDALKTLIDTGTEFLSILTNIVDLLGSIPTLIGGITAVSSLKNVGEPIKQFHYPITLGYEYAHKVSNGNMNDTMCKLVA